VTLDIILLAVGLVGIVRGGEWFVASSVRLAELLRMPRVVIGSTLVSLATTTPEMTVSVFAGLTGQPGIAVGNAVGSSVCNLLMILGAMALVKQLELHLALFRIPFLVMFGTGILLLVLTADLRLDRWQGLCLTLLGVTFFVGDFFRHRRETAWVAVEAVELETEFVERHRWLRTSQGTSALFVLGAILVVGGSRLVVDAGVRVAEGLGVPPMVLGLSLLAVGTSLPELVTAISSARQDVSDLAIGNLLGANIANLTLIIGSASAIHSVEMNRVTQQYNFPALLCAMVLVGMVGLSGRQVTRREGFLLLGCYVLYLIGVISLSFFP
jgi:cation:H+ antiporter